MTAPKSSSTSSALPPDYELFDHDQTQHPAPPTPTPPFPTGIFMTILVLATILTVDWGIGLQIMFRGPPSANPFRSQFAEELIPVFMSQIFISFFLVTFLIIFSQLLNTARSPTAPAAAFANQHGDGQPGSFGEDQGSSDGGGFSITPSFLIATLVEAIFVYLGIACGLGWGHIMGWFVFVFWITFAVDLFLLGLGRRFVRLLTMYMTAKMQGLQSGGYRPVPVRDVDDMTRAEV